MLDNLYRGNRRWRRYATLLAALGLMASVGVTASFAAKAPPKLKINPIFTYNKADRRAHLYACAKTEGSLTLYTSSSATDPSLKPAFQAAYPGVTLNTYVATTALVPRLVQEEDSGHHNFDVYNDTMGNMHRDSKYFQPFWSPYMSTVQPALTSPYFLGSNGFIFPGVYYNPNIVAPADVPKTWKDLLKPALKGKIYIGTDATAPIVTALLRRTYCVGYYQALAKQVHVVNTAGRGVADLVIAGTAPMGFEMSSSYYKTNHILQNAPLLLQVLNPMYGAYQASSISKYAPHPCAAMLYVDWLTDPKGGGAVFNTLGNASPTKAAAAAGTILPFNIPGQIPQSKWKITFQTSADLIKGFKNYDQAYAAWTDLYNRYFINGH
jgi:iron(III) transport system substrate-binding protein